MKSAGWNMREQKMEKEVPNIAWIKKKITISSCGLLNLRNNLLKILI